MKQERLLYIDWIRILAFGLLIMLHCIVPFTSIRWEINNAESSATLTQFTLWLHQWRLPLLFFVSGLGVQLSLQNRSIGAFYAERFRRLFIPLLFAMFFTIPIQPYFEFLQKGKISPGYLPFYQQVWDFKVYPDGPLTWSHMWFVVYLIAFLLILFPVFLVGKNKTMAQYADALRNHVGHPLALLLPAFLITMIMYSLSIEYPENGSLTEDWFAFLLFISLLFIGFLVGPSRSFWERTARIRWYTGAVSLATGLLLLNVYWKQVPVFTARDKRFLLYCIVDGIHIWTMILFCCGMAKQYLNRNSRLLNYLNKAVYPYYIIHQTIIVALGYFIVQWPLPLWGKCLLLMVLSIIAILTIYQFIIRRTSITRFLFGMK